MKRERKTSENETGSESAETGSDRSRARSGSGGGAGEQIRALHGTVGNRGVRDLFGSPDSSRSSSDDDSGRDVPYRSEMESAFGEEFTSVRAHSGMAGVARRLDAEAFTHGNRIGFANSNPDREVVAHELTHVVQQRRADRAAGRPAGVSSWDDPAEHEARQVAARVASGRDADRIEADPAAPTHRQESVSNFQDAKSKIEGATKDSWGGSESQIVFDTIENAPSGVRGRLAGDSEVMSWVESYLSWQNRAKAKAKLWEAAPPSVSAVEEELYAYMDGMGTAEWAMVTVLDSLSPSTLQSLADDQELVDRIKSETSGDEEAQAVAKLRPFMDRANVGGGEEAETPWERLKTSTKGTWGGDYETTVEILNELSAQKRAELAEKNDGQLLEWVHGQFSGTQLDRILGLLMEGQAGSGGESEGAEPEGSTVEAASEDLLGKLREQTGYLNDSEEGMLKLVRKYEEKFSSVGAYDPRLAELRTFLRGELSSAGYTQAIEVLNRGVDVPQDGDGGAGAEGSGQATGGTSGGTGGAGGAAAVASGSGERRRSGRRGSGERGGSGGSSWETKGESKGGDSGSGKTPVTDAEVQDLLRRLRAQTGYTYDSESGMMEEIATFAENHAAVEDVESGPIKEVTEWVRGELGHANYNKYESLLETGGAVGTKALIETDKLTDLTPLNQRIADHFTESGGGADANAVLTTVANASKADRKEAAAEIEKQKNGSGRFYALLENSLTQSEFGRMERLLHSELTGESLTAFKTILGELDAWTYSSDDQILTAVENIDPENLDAIRDNEGLRRNIENALGGKNVQRFHEIIGYRGGSEGDGSGESGGGDVAGSARRLLGRLERHCDNGEEAKLVQAVVEFQNAGGELEKGSEQLEAARTYVTLTLQKWDELEQRAHSALTGDAELTQRDRLKAATGSADAYTGTDDEQFEKVISKVTNEEAPPGIKKQLIDEFSNLGRYEQLFAEHVQGKNPDDVDFSALKGFVPDINSEVRTMLTDKSDWVDQQTKLREAIVAALKEPEIKRYAAENYNYLATEQLLLLSKYFNAVDVHEHNRSGFSTWVEEHGWKTEIFEPINFNNYTARDDEEASAFGHHEKDVRGTTEEGLSEEEREKRWEEAGESYEKFKEKSAALEQARQATADVAGAIGGTIAGALVTLATGGVATPAVAGIIGGISGAAVTEVTEAAVEGADYNAQQGAQDMAVELAKSLATAGLEKYVADPLIEGAASSELLQKIHSAIGSQHPNLVRFLGDTGEELVKQGIVEFPTGVGIKAATTEDYLMRDILSEEFYSRVREGCQALLVSFLQRSRDSLFSSNERLAELAEQGDTEGLKRELYLQQIQNEAMKYAVGAAIEGEPFSPEQAADFIAGMISLPQGKESWVTKDELTQTELVNKRREAKEYFNSAFQSTRSVGVAKLTELDYIDEGIARKLYEDVNGRDSPTIDSLSEIRDLSGGDQYLDFLAVKAKENYDGWMEGTDMENVYQNVGPDAGGVGAGPTVGGGFGGGR